MTAIVTVLVFVLGVWDQSISGAVPAYAATKATVDSDGSFVDRIVAQVPAGSMIFQIPAIAYPSNGKPNNLTAGNQLRLWLQPSSLKWSGGGVTGRPETDWPSAVTKLPTAQMVRDLAAIGFAGITVDRSAGGGEIRTRAEPGPREAAVLQHRQELRLLLADRGHEEADRDHHRGAAPEARHGHHQGDNGPPR